MFGLVNLNSVSYKLKPINKKLLNLLLEKRSIINIYESCGNSRNITSSSKTDVDIKFQIKRFNDVHIQSNNLKEFYQQIQSNANIFENKLKDLIGKCKNENRSAIWIYVPIELSGLASICAKYDFKYHNAENNQAVLYKWLRTDCESKIPLFATHQMGVAGAVYCSERNQLLVIKDRAMIKDVWKFPGGAANLSENIQDTAIREVFEETGIKTEFASILGFRQQHDYPNAHGRSDLYVVCRLKPLTYEINACKDEIKECKWIDLDFMCNYTENNLTKVISKLVKYGAKEGFDKIDIKPKHMFSIFPGRSYNFFYRDVNLDD